MCLSMNILAIFILAFASNCVYSQDRETMQAVRAAKDFERFEYFLAMNFLTDSDEGCEIEYNAIIAGNNVLQLYTYDGRFQDDLAFLQVRAF